MSGGGVVIASRRASKDVRLLTGDGEAIQGMECGRPRFLDRYAPAGSDPREARAMTAPLDSVRRSAAELLAQRGPSVHRCFDESAIRARKYR